jgi:hypothetical protein
MIKSGVISEGNVKVFRLKEEEKCKTALIDHKYFLTPVTSKRSELLVICLIATNKLISKCKLLSTVK